MKKFLLFSDIHATDADPTSSSAPSYVSSYASAAAGSPEPISDLVRLLQDEGQEVDYLLCAGDITNKGSPTALTFACEKIQWLSDKLAATLVTTVGNHDLNSRFKTNSYDPRGYAMSVKPAIPIADREKYLEYWAEHFTILNEPDCNILIINTAAYHGGGTDMKKIEEELEHGRISDLTLNKIKDAMTALPERDINIVLCHHHPIKAEPSDENLVGYTRGGEKLVELLGESGRPWTVVHGHKHRPDLLYGHGASNAPTIISCASFSSQVNADAQNKNPNQVHLLTCDPSAATTFNSYQAGTVRSWTWQPGIGWARSNGGQGLPHRAGFGFRGNVKPISKRLGDELDSAGVAFIPWETAIVAVPELTGLIPADLAILITSLQTDGLTVLYDKDGQIAQIGRAA